jgi:peptide/nickel transport system permease protein
VVIFAELIVPYQKAVENDPLAKLQGPSAEHIFGTDTLGRDLFARLIHGSRISLLLGFGATAISGVIASILGSLTAYLGGKFDDILMRLFDIISAIPAVLLSLSIAAGFDRGIPQLLIAISIPQIAGFTRVTRSAVLSIVSQDYIEAAKAIGISNFRIVISHIVPNALGTILVQATMQVSANILMGAMLSFLGLGAPEPTPEWGTLMKEGLNVIRHVTHTAIFPTIFIAVTALSINIFGDGLRDAFDPRLKGKA